MNGKFFGRNAIRTKHVSLDTRKCKACWKCIDNCSGQVIGKVEFFSHMHAKIVYPSKCNGCLMCVKECKFNAISPVENIRENKTEEINNMKEKFNKRAFVSTGLLISGIILPVSGIMNHKLGFSPLEGARHFWMSMHNMSGILFTIFAIFHVIMNMETIKKHLFAFQKNVMKKEAVFALLFVAVIVLLFSSHALHAR